MAACVLAAVTAGCASDDVPAPFLFERGAARAGFYVHGEDREIVGVAAIATLESVQPFVLRSAEALDAVGSPAVTLRAVFHGRGSTPDGQTRSQESPGVVCGYGPVRSFGPSYPIENLRVAGGETVKIVAYASAASPGAYRVSGVAVRYEGAQGSGVARWHETALEMYLVAPGEPLGEGICNPRLATMWTGA